MVDEHHAKLPYSGRTTIRALMCIPVMIGVVGIGMPTAAAAGSEPVNPSEAIIGAPGISGGERGAEPTPGGGLSDTWTVKNYTDQPLHGVALKQSGSQTSTIYLPPDTPLQPGRSVSAELVSMFLKLDYLWGRFCYDGWWFDLPRKNYSGNQFHLDIVPIAGPHSYLTAHIDGTLVFLDKSDPC